MHMMQVIDKYSRVNAVWMPDVVGRAYGNRGNARSRQVRARGGVHLHAGPSAVPASARAVLHHTCARACIACAPCHAPRLPLPPDACAQTRPRYAPQGRLPEALSDFNSAMGLAPWSVDPVLNRGVVLEAMGR